MPYSQKRALNYAFLFVITFSVTTIVWVNHYLQKKNSIYHNQRHGSNAITLREEIPSHEVKLNSSNSPPTEEGGEVLHKTYLTSRSQCPLEYFLLIMVMSSPYNFKRRSAIRNTWAGGQSEERWKTVFLVGQGEGETVQNQRLAAEEEMHRDLIRGAQKEHYRNLTLKTQMGLEWASKYCNFQFLVKADDDVFVDPHAMINHLKRPDTPKTNLYTGRCTHRGFPKRGGGKYAVSWEEYNKTRYPPFCAGPAYVLSHDLVPRLVNLFNNVKNPLPLEDVYIGTLINKIGGVKAIWHPGFRTLEYGPCRYHSDIFAYHQVKGEMCMNELFKSAMKERDKQKQQQAVFLR
ncbi:beta-1,3-galactosyltransferase 5-like [Acropora palmata]|uniref:beta-1,3-galactosyltransferase 5-like n=1 Tax=Acropora palmata TaxID=6131 RepID=UPI003DA086A2